MNHSNNRKFKRDSAQKKALMKHLAEAVILEERVRTTTAKAKEVAPFVNKLITRAKKQDLLAAKMIHAAIADEAAKKLLTDIAKRYEKRDGGYTRIVKLGERKGDAAKVSIIELV